MRLIICLLFICLSTFAFKWIYANGEGVLITTDCRLLKSNWTARMETIKKELEGAPVNIRLFLSSLLTEKDYFVENCEVIEALTADEVFRRAQSAYQNDPGNFQSFEHYRADLIEKMDKIHFFALKGALLSEADYWEVSIRQAFLLGHEPFLFSNDFSRRVAIIQSIISILTLIFLFLPATRKLKRSGLH